MSVDVYHHISWDPSAGRNITIPRFSTEKRIRKINGEIVTATKRQIDEKLLDPSGDVIIQASDEDWKTLSELASLAGQRGTISGNKSRKYLDRLTEKGLIISRAVNVSDTEHEVTDLGRLALKHLA